MKNLRIDKKESMMKKAWGGWWQQKKCNNLAFLEAAEKGDMEAINKLFNPGSISVDLMPDVNSRGIDQWTALHFAAHEGHRVIIEFLLRRSETEIEAMTSLNRTPLHLAALKGQIEAGRLLVDAGASPMAKDADENTPMHLASEFGHGGFIIFLVKECGAELTEKNKFGYCPFDIAMDIEIKELFEQLRV